MYRKIEIILQAFWDSVHYWLPCFVQVVIEVGILVRNIFLVYFSAHSPAKFSISSVARHCHEIGHPFDAVQIHPLYYCQKGRKIGRLEEYFTIKSLIHNNNRTLNNLDAVFTNHFIRFTLNYAPHAPFWFILNSYHLRFSVYFSFSSPYDGPHLGTETGRTVSKIFSCQFLFYL